MIGEALAMISGRRGDDATLGLIVGELQQGVEGPALLIGGCELEVLELNPDLSPGNL